MARSARDPLAHLVVQSHTTIRNELTRRVPNHFSLSFKGIYLFMF